MNDYDINPFVLFPNKYFEIRGLGSNSILCGERADREALRRVSRILVENGVHLQYIGPFPPGERNGDRNSIDIRSVGDREFYGNRKVINLNDLKRMDWGAKELCGTNGELFTTGLPYSDEFPVNREVEIKWSSQHDKTIVQNIIDIMEDFTVDLKKTELSSNNDEARSYSGRVWYYYEEDRLLASRITAKLNLEGWHYQLTPYLQINSSETLPVRIWVSLE